MTEQIKAISERWKALSDADRQPYLDRAAADKARYQAEKAAVAEVRRKTNTQTNIHTHTRRQTPTT